MPDELPISETPELQQPVQTQPDEFLATVRSLVDGLPDNYTRDDFVGNVLEWQEKASRAEQLEAELNQLRSNQAAAAAEFAAKQQVAPVAAPTEDDFKLPWNLTKVDPSLEGLCKVDPESGMYIPRNEFSATHQKAAEEMNQHAMQARQFIHALTTDPEGTAAILTKRQLAAMEKKFSAELEAFKSQFEPIQQRAEADKRQASIDEFAGLKRAELFTPENEMSPLGEIMNDYLEDGLSPKDAYDKAVRMAKKLNLSAPVAPVEPTPKPSLAPAKQQAGRFIDSLSSRSRLPVDRPEFEEGPKKHMTNADMRKKYGISNTN